MTQQTVSGAAGDWRITALPIGVYDVTFENVQAGLRTDYLFRLANHHGGIVLGTGDLSELALGWCTYGVGDQMSHYNVNSGVPKTRPRNDCVVFVMAGLVPAIHVYKTSAQARHGCPAQGRA